MIRFSMPSPGYEREDCINALKDQFEGFLNASALQALFSILGVDAVSIRRVYDGRRKSGGRTLETQELEPLAALEQYRDDLYPLFSELGSFHINKPLSADYTRIIVLGGSLRACNTRTEYAKLFFTDRIRSVDALTAFRPINPVERSASSHTSGAETECGVLTEAFMRVFGLAKYEDQFTGDRNLNRISCVRTFSDSGTGGQCTCGIYAAPSSEPSERRADTGDTLSFYMGKADLTDQDRLLFITDNRYCNRQFLQLAYQILMSGSHISFDIIGCSPDDSIPSKTAYDPFQYIQDLIGILDWIHRFRTHIVSGGAG